jgi:hypothetical protein
VFDLHNDISNTDLTGRMYCNVRKSCRIRSREVFGIWEYFYAEFTNCFCFVGLEVLAVVVMNVAIFWDIAPCSLYVKRRFGGTCLLLQVENQPSKKPAYSRWLPSKTDLLVLRRPSKPQGHGTAGRIRQIKKILMT